MIFQAIKQRFCALLLPQPLPESAMQRAVQFAAGLGVEGTWEDLVWGSDGSEATDAPPEHLQRTMLLAQANRSRDGEFGEPLRRALDFWLANDFEAPDWRQNQLVVPRTIGSIAVLFEEGLSQGAHGKVMEILARSRWQHWTPQVGWSDWTGITLLQVAYNVILCGCLSGTPMPFEEAFTRIFGAIRIAPDGEAGIQPDMIYHASHTVPTAGDEGLAYATDCARFVVLAHGTQWQAPVEATTLLATFILNGQQWLMRHGMVDAHSIAHVSKLRPTNRDDLATVVEHLAQFADTPRRSELAALARRLVGRGETLAGHRHFWRSGFSVHQRPAYYTSVRLAPARGDSLERTPAQPTSESASDEGVTSVMRTGHEYENLPSSPDQSAPPGTTFPYPPKIPDELPSAQRTALLAGGVSEGDYGVAALQSERSGVTAVKSWYYFDHSFVCLGAGINAWSTDSQVFTSVNRCRLNGPVVTEVGAAAPLTLAAGTEHNLSGVKRIAHDGVTYDFIQPANLVARVGIKNGTESAVESPVPEPFTLWLAHGAQPREATYAYMMLPLGNDAASTAKIDEETIQVEILANTPGLQAVRHRALRLTGITFWQAGLLVLPDGGRVAANQPCVLLCRDTPSVGKRLSIANLKTEAMTVHVEYAGRCLCFELPGGPDAGRGISRSL